MGMPVRTGHKTDQIAVRRRCNLRRWRVGVFRAREPTFRVSPDPVEGTALHCAEQSRDYVRTGTGGRRNAVRRMAPSRVAAGRTLGVFRGLQRDGTQETLRRLNLQRLSGGSVQEIFIGLTEVICQDGGSIDEAIARDAWLETIAELDQFGIDDLDALRGEQVRELFLTFVAHSIEARLYQEIGISGFKISARIDDIASFDRQFREYIERSVRDSFSSDISELSNMSDRDLRRVVDTTYFEVWKLLELLGDQEV